MPEITNTFFVPACSLFFRPESSNINSLILISFPRVRERIKAFYGSFRCYWAFYSGKQRDFPLLFRCSSFEKPRHSAAHGHFAAVFRWNNSENSRARLARRMDPGAGPKGPSRDDASRQLIRP